MLGQRTQARVPVQRVADSALFQALELCSWAAGQRAGLPPILTSTVSLPVAEEGTIGVTPVGLCKQSSHRSRCLRPLICSL